MDAGEPRHDLFDAGLYAASTVALNVDDGKLAWHYQHMPGESLDLDEVYERVLVDIGDEKSVFTIGKAGILWKLDRTSGSFVGGDGCPRLFDRIDRRPACRPIVRTSSSQQVDKWVQSCPSTEGGHNWQAMSYNPGVNAWSSR